MTGKKIRWGIMGAGIIAGKFVDAVRSVEDCEIRAAASKSPDRARDFAERHKIPGACSYEELVRSADIDAVYIATTHNFHFANAHLALSHGKPVLLEKPFTVNAAEARQLVQLARSRNLFLMEAMWIRFLPSHARLRGLIRSGRIGQVRQVNVAFGNFVHPQFEKRLDDPELAGGVTLDMGVYPVSFISDMLGENPIEVRSYCRRGDSGVDEIADYLLRYPSGCLALVSTSYRLKMDGNATFYGTEGELFYPENFRGENFTLHMHEGTNDIIASETICTPNEKNGFVHQIREASRCLRSGLIESPLMPLDDTLAIMGVMDRIRQDWGWQNKHEQPDDRSEHPSAL